MLRTRVNLYNFTKLYHNSYGNGYRLIPMNKFNEMERHKEELMEYKSQMRSQLDTLDGERLESNPKIIVNHIKELRENNAKLKKLNDDLFKFLIKV